MPISARNRGRSGRHRIRRARQAADPAIEERFSASYESAERSGAPKEALEAISNSRSLKMAALDGDIEWGKVESRPVPGLVRKSSRRPRWSRISSGRWKRRASD